MKKVSRRQFLKGAAALVPAIALPTLRLAEPEQWHPQIGEVVTLHVPDNGYCSRCGRVSYTSPGRAINATYDGKCDEYDIFAIDKNEQWVCPRCGQTITKYFDRTVCFIPGNVSARTDLATIRWS